MADFAANGQGAVRFVQLQDNPVAQLDAIDAALPLAWDRLVVGGRMAAISFHSLEDRRVKQFFAGLATGCICPPDLPVCACGNEPEAELLTRRSITADDAELELNPRSRSARLRGALKITEGRP